MQPPPDLKPQPQIEIPAPPHVRRTANLILLYSLVIMLVQFVFAFLTHRWVLALAGVLQLTLYFGVWGALYRLNRWAWWLCVLGGGFYILRFVVGILAGGMRWALHQPQHPLFLTHYIIGLIFFIPIVIRLLMRESRVAFGISK